MIPFVIVVWNSMACIIHFCFLSTVPGQSPPNGQASGAAHPVLRKCPTPRSHHVQAGAFALRAPSPASKVWWRPDGDHKAPTAFGHLPHLCPARPNRTAVPRTAPCTDTPT